MHPDRARRRMSVGMLCLGKHWNGLIYDYEDRRSDFDNLPVPAIPPRLAELATARRPTPASRCVRHGIANYTPDAKLGVHQDRTGGRRRSPRDRSCRSPSATRRFVVGGLSRKDPPTHYPALGDVLVMGGPSRLRYHGVTHQPTAPEATGQADST